jgi:hypothetical protein
VELLDEEARPYSGCPWPRCWRSATLRATAGCAMRC